MLVETFECEETKSEHIECSDEAVKIIEEMGLSGQQKLISRVNDERPTRCPYRKATKEEKTVYGLICPSQGKLSEYADAPIPLRVLQVAMHAKSLNFFEEFVVWSATSADVKDPVLFATRKEPGTYGPTTEYYILARWGDALDEWPAMLKIAGEKWKDKVRDHIQSLQDRISNYQSKLGNTPSVSLMSEGIY